MSYLQNTKDQFLQANPDQQQMIQSLEFPSLKNENWKYTNLNRLYDQDFPLADEQEITWNEDENFVYLNLFYQREQKNLKFGDYEIIPCEVDEFDFDRADFLDLLVLCAPRLTYKIKCHSETAKPIYINLINHSPVQSYFMLTYESDFNFKMLLHFQGKGHIHFAQSQNLKANQQFEQFIIQAMDPKEGFFSFNSTVTQPKDSVFSQVILNTGAKVSRANINQKLQGQGAEADLHGLYILGQKQHHDTCSLIQHLEPRNYSRQVYKGILNDESKGIFNGKVFVEKDAQLIEAEQLNQNLVLNQKAQAYSRPQMQINADDVKCAHGSTTGQLSEEELFYFESRGIRVDRAKEMLAKGFALDVLMKIKDSTLQKIAIDYLNQQVKYDV